MKTKEELNLILTLIRKHNLPLSPILEYAIQEKIDECSEGEFFDDSILEERTSKVPEESSDLFEEKEGKKPEPVETGSNTLRIVEFGKRGIAVVGDTKSHRLSLRAMGGYYMSHTVFGPAWVFPLKKQKKIQAYIDGDTSVVVEKQKHEEKHNVDKWRTDTNEKTSGKPLNKRRFVLETVRNYVCCHPSITYEGLIKVFPASLSYNKSNGVVKLYDDVVKKISLNPNARKYFFLKDNEIIQLLDGVKVVVHSQWGDDFDMFLKVAEKIFHVIQYREGYLLDTSSIQATRNDDLSSFSQKESEKDKRIGYIVRLMPSQLEGEIVRTKVDKKGTKKLVIKTTLSGNVIEINDLPFLYEIIQRETKTDEIGEKDDEVFVKKTIETEPTTETKVTDIISESDLVSDSRSGKTWTEDEEELITNYFQEGKDCATIAELVGRTELAIKSRLAKLGLIEYTYGEDESSSELEVEHVYLDNKGNVVKTEVEGRKEKKQEEGWQLEEKENNKNAEELIKKIDKRWNDFVRNETEEKNIEEAREKKSKKEAGSSFSVPIGTKVRLLPSQIEGVVINHLISKSGERRIVIEKKDGSQMSAQDHPYLYEIVKKKTKRKRIGETRRDKGDKHDVKRKETERVSDGSIKEQFRAFLAKQKSESTVNGYTSTLDSAIRRMIKQDVDAQADSIFSYTTVEDVQICIDLLKETSDFRKENARRHNGLTAALNQYLKFVEERGKK